MRAAGRSSLPGRGARPAAGFSLIEVLIAIFVFAAAATVLTEAFVNTLLSLETMEREGDPLPDLRFVRQTVIKEPDLETFEEGGEIETLGSGVATWEVEVEPTQVSDLFSVVLTIEMTPPKAEAPEVFTEKLLLLRPTWSDPVDRSELLQENTERLQDQRRDRGLLGGSRSSGGSRFSSGGSDRSGGRASNARGSSNTGGSGRGR